MNTQSDPLFAFEISDGFRISIEIGAWVAPVLLLAGLGAIIWACWYRGWFGFGSFDLDSAEIGIGDTRMSFSPNRTDRQIAYAIWVELSTRKIGLEIDPEHDVISEVYDSWYDFFGVTRNLIKEVPAHKLRSKGTRAIVRASVQVLNEGLRPHLTRWQARYRRWYDSIDPGDSREPQVIQQEFPKYEELVADLLAINAKLINYRRAMYKLATGDPEDTIDIEAHGNPV
jgi:hypothetical protein